MADPKEVVEMRESLTSFARLARRATRTARESQRSLRLVLSSITTMSPDAQQQSEAPNSAPNRPLESA